jgi:hypothetical protein
LESKLKVKEKSLQVQKPVGYFLYENNYGLKKKTEFSNFKEEK